MLNIPEAWAPNLTKNAFNIVPGATFPDYELPDHTGKTRRLSDLQGPDPLIVMLGRGGYCPKDRRQLDLREEK